GARHPCRRAVASPVFRAPRATVVYPLSLHDALPISPHLLSPEDRKQPVEISDMFIDIGARSRAEAEELGVLPGDPVVPICPFTPLGKGDLLMAKAWDNRAGCAVAVRLLHELKGTDHPNTVYAVGTVQEEVGLRGAQTMSERINPDVAFAVDVAIAGDTPGIKEH